MQTNRLASDNLPLHMGTSRYMLYACHNGQHHMCTRYRWQPSLHNMTVCTCDCHLVTTPPSADQE